MSKLTAYLLLLLPVVLIYGLCCTPISIHEFYTEDQVMFEPKLVGDWIEEDGEPLSFWSFSDSGEGFYWLNQSAFAVDEETNKFVTILQQEFYAYLFEFDGELYFDIVPHFADGEFYTYNGPTIDTQALNTILTLCSVYGHTLWHVTQIEPELKFSPLSVDMVEEYLLEHPAAVESTEWGDKEGDTTYGTLLISDTAGLQSFMSEVLKADKAFDDDTPLYQLVRLSESEHLDEIDEPMQYAPLD